MFSSQFAICATLFLIGSVTNAIKTRQLHEENLSPKEIAMRFYNAFAIEFDEEEAAKYIGPDYIQHSPIVPTGPDATLAFIPILKSMDSVTIIHRVIAEGDLVVFHSTHKNSEIFEANTLVAMDVFRVEDGKLVEHWDSIQPKSGPNLSGRSMTGGRKNIKDLSDECDEKQCRCSKRECRKTGFSCSCLTKTTRKEFLSHRSKFCTGLFCIAYGLCLHV